MTSTSNVLPITAARTTRGLICQSGNLNLATIPIPRPGVGEIVVQVKAVGLCRTDLYAISGEIETFAERFVPGHEFAGIVIEKGPAVSDLVVGDRVVINPVVDCGECLDCHADANHLCSNAKLMGIDLDGAIRQEIVVPRTQAYPIAKHLEFAEAAFAEPVAASLAILNSAILPNQTGLIIGSSRIAELARRVLLATGFKSVLAMGLEEARNLPSNQFDFVVEAEASTAVFKEMGRLVRPRGKLILKSRQHRPLEITLRNIIDKEPTIKVVNYGRFDQALELLVNRDVTVDDLIGQQYGLEEFSKAIAVAANDEAKKIFLAPEN